MKVRIVCQRCSGELQIPQTAAGKKVRCPFCGNVFSCPTGGEAASRNLPAAEAMESSTPWSPLDEEDLDGPIPWYLLLGALAPAGLLYFVAIEPIALSLAVALVVIAIIVAVRRSWSRMTRFFGITLIGCLAFGSAAAVHHFAEGSFARIPFKWPTSFPGSSSPPPGIDFAKAAWKDISPGQSGCTLLFPGTPTASKIGEPNGIDVFVQQASFSNPTTTFALHYFDLTLPATNEAAELFALTKMDMVLRWLFFEGDVDQQKKIFYYEHPGMEYHFSVAGKPTRIVCQSFLVRNRAYLVSVTSDKYDAVRGEADKFFASFQLAKTTEAFRTPVTDSEPDWKALGRPPIPRVKAKGSYRGHMKAPILVLAFSGDGKRLYTGTGREHVLQWDLATGHGRAIAGTDAYPYIALDPRRKRLVAPAPNGVATPVDIHFVPLDEAYIPLGAANTDYFGFHPDERTVLTPLEGKITAWDAVEGKQLWGRAAHFPAVACMALSRDGRLVATTGVKDQIIKLWDVSTKGGDLAILKGHAEGVRRGSPIQQLAFAPDGLTLASAGLDTSAKIWSFADINNPKLRASLPHEQPVSCLEYSNNGKLLATGDFQGNVRLWDPVLGKMLHEFRASEVCEPIQAVRFSPDDRKLAAAVEMGLERVGVVVFDVIGLPTPQEPSISFQQTEEPPLFKE